MDEPIKHDTSSALATGATKAGIGAAIGLGVAALAGAAIFAGGLIAGGAALGWVASAVSSNASAGAMATWLTTQGTGGVITAVAAAVGAVSGASAGTIPALIGAGVGAIKGGSQVSAENRAYNEQVEQLTHSRQHKMAAKVNDAEISAIQQVYPVAFGEGRDLGRQEGAVAVIQQIQAAQGKDTFIGGDGASLASVANATATATATANCACGPVVGQYTQNVANERAAQAQAAAVGATAVNQVG